MSCVGFVLQLDRGGKGSVPARRAGRGGVVLQEPAKILRELGGVWAEALVPSALKAGHTGGDGLVGWREEEEGCCHVL